MGAEGLASGFLAMGSIAGIGALTLAADNKYGLIDRYLQYRNGHQVSESRAMLEFLALSLSTGAFLAYGTSALAAWAARRVYLADKSVPEKSKKTISWRQWFFNLTGKTIKSPEKPVK